MQYLQSESDLDKFQFGFKRGHSTSLCTNIYIQTVDYFTTRGSHVFVCFVDFNKAFDNVSYCKLFSKLLDDNVNCMIVRLLGFLSRVSILLLTRDIDIVILSVCPSVCLSVCPSVRDTLVLYENGLTYRHSFSTIR